MDDFNNIDTVENKKQDNEKTTLIKNSSGDIFVKLDKNNKIISYVNNTIEKLGSNFLSFNTSISELYLPKVKTIGCKAFINNNKLRRLSLPEVEEIAVDFLKENQDIEELYLPKVRIIYSNFLALNKKLKKLSLPEVKEIGNGFLASNKKIKKNIITCGEKNW